MEQVDSSQGKIKKEFVQQLLQQDYRLLIKAVILL